ncbi:oxidoreductase [Malassezia pachydermatis]|uniref:Family dioxygenase n=1 Tax=Malassezia pachydermatis TaxID=77020 RepID=A0A0M9VP93_9BASI|nr:family dioxygenase [Malassezia pachydermatis]KOS14183.1 family dioxygenase [Malassezia pachydermatis]
MTKAPAIFIGHGSPMNAIQESGSTRAWAQLGQKYPAPKAIVAISAHWYTHGVRIMSNEKPETIHDFGNFPQALYDMQYPAPGEPALASKITNMLKPFNAKLDSTWGLDHGTWSILVHMYPKADIPVVQVSLDAMRSPAEHMDIGRALAPLREDNVLILASGNIVHNLRALNTLSGAAPWTESFDNYITDAVRTHNETALLDYHKRPEAPLAAPDWEHFFPVFYAMGARLPGEKPTIMKKDPDRPGLTMSLFAYGVP